ncbi:hypothetical protein DNTS_020629 [Danionella cerebrum]|uniref:PDZ domain-containing protein n=1 Tax=Danionella cerebrum TaxID=2873325 RepID=A0A553RJY5_9TELE|nr:hypothetical protein DNTS_020629 [Danionella translucida]
MVTIWLRVSLQMAVTEDEITQSRLGTQTPLDPSPPYNPWAPRLPRSPALKPVSSFNNRDCPEHSRGPDTRLMKFYSGGLTLLPITCSSAKNLDDFKPFPAGSLPRKKKGLAGLRQAPQKTKTGLLISLPLDFRQVSSIIDADILPETHLRVRLHKHGTHKPLGFYIRDGVSVRVTSQGVEKVPGVFISRLVKGGLAESTGLLGVNDEILEVNGIDVAGKSLDQVTDMMVANSHNLIVTVKPANLRNNTIHRASKTSAGNSSAGSGGSALSHDSAPSPASQNACQNSNSNSVAEVESDDDTDLIIENDNMLSYRMTNGNGSHGNTQSSGALRSLPQSFSLPSSSSLSSLTTPTQNGSPTKTSSSQESMREDGNFITL